MFLSDYIAEDTIALELRGEDKKSIIEKMAQILTDAKKINNKDVFIEGIQKREEIESTAIGNGIAIPHTRGDFCDRIAVCLGRINKGVNFNALDGKPVYIIFMIAAPTTAQKEYLQLIAKVARFLRAENNRKRILRAGNKEEIIQVIKDFDAKFPGRESVKTKDGRVIHKEM